jgi:hypothetical protein
MKDKSGDQMESGSLSNLQSQFAVKKRLNWRCRSFANKQSKLDIRGVGKQNAICNRIKELLDIMLARIRATEGLTGNEIKKDQLVLIVKDVIESNCKASIQVAEENRKGGLRHNRILKRLIDIFTTLLWKEKSVPAKTMNDIQIPDDVVNNVSEAIPHFVVCEGGKNIVRESSYVPSSDVNDRNIFTYDKAGSNIGIEHSADEFKDVFKKFESSRKEDVAFTPNSSHDSSSYESYDEELTTVQILVEELMFLFRTYIPESLKDRFSQEYGACTVSGYQELSFESKDTSRHDELSLLSEDYNVFQISHENESMLSKFFGNSSECSSVHIVDEDEFEDEIKGNHSVSSETEIMVFDCIRYDDGESLTKKYTDYNLSKSILFFRNNSNRVCNSQQEPLIEQPSKSYGFVSNFITHRL